MPPSCRRCGFGSRPHAVRANLSRWRLGTPSEGAAHATSAGAPVAFPVPPQSGCRTEPGLVCCESVKVYPSPGGCDGRYGHWSALPAGNPGAERQEVPAKGFPPEAHDRSICPVIRAASCWVQRRLLVQLVGCTMLPYPVHGRHDVKRTRRTIKNVRWHDAA